MAREANVQIRMNDKIKVKLQDYAERYGLTMSSLGAFIIGQWLDNQDRVVKPMLDKFADLGVVALKDEVKKMLEVLGKAEEERPPVE